jgi:hypothetical protein
MALLSQRWSLWDVGDVEALCWSIVKRYRLELNHHEREDLVTYLIETCWSLSVRYEPGGITFCTYATNNLKLRVVDWERQRFGRRTWKFKNAVYERPQVELVSLDADESFRDRLESSVAGSGLDDDASSFASDMRTLSERARRPGRRDEWLGDEAA